MASSFETSHEVLLKRIGKNIRRQRKTRRWTQERLAEAAQLSTYFVGEVERGHAALSLRSLLQIARALRAPLAVFLEGDQEYDRALLLDELSEHLQRASAEEVKLLVDVAARLVRERR